MKILVAVNLLGADLTNGRYDQLAAVDAVNLTRDIWTANRYQTKVDPYLKRRH
jgi:hypothetical protein